MVYIFIQDTHKDIPIWKSGDGTDSFTFHQTSQFLPAINFRALVWVPKNNFWRGVERAAAKRLQQIFAKNVGEAKVSYFCPAVFIQQNVLQLEVSMADVVLKKMRC